MLVSVPASVANRTIASLAAENSDMVDLMEGVAGLIL